MKKVLLVLLFLFLPLVSSYGANVVTLRYGVWMSEQIDGIKAQISAFEKKNPDIKIKLEHVPWEDYWTKLQTMLAGGDCWDVFTMDNGFYLKDYVKRGAILDITPFIEKEKIDLSVYPTGVLALHKVDGKFYSLPRDYDTIAIFYNKDAFDEAKLRYPDASWTWDDVKKAAEKLTKKDAKGVTLRYGVTAGGGALSASQVFLFPFILSLEGKIVNEEGKVVLDSNEAKEVLNFAKELTSKGYAPTPGATTENLFLAGRSAINFDGAWMLGYYAENIKKFKWGVAILPKSKTGKRANISDSLGNVIWANTKNKDSAWRFVKWLAGKEAAEILGKTGTVIPAYKGADKLWVDSFRKLGREKDAQVFIDSVKYTNPWPQTIGASNWFDRWETYYIVEIISGRLGVEEGLKQAVEEINSIIEEHSK
ncbi:MAG: sugar ABC transporter substrate-binding protein [Dictyoglomus sp. NZ13-RE01]|nr:MAG: sugar ABC transporter substrate-binding protein [Dictyoglomus sp. NZ13-RE01]